MDNKKSRSNVKQPEEQCNNDTIQIKTAINHLGESIDHNNELIKMLLISNMMKSSECVDIISSHIEYDDISKDVYDALNSEFELEQFLIFKIPCLILIPRIKLKMQYIYETYQFIKNKGICCIIASEDFTPYELRRCRELNINRIDIKRKTLEIKY